MNKKVEIVLAKYGCLFMKDDNKEMFSEIEEVYKEAQAEQIMINPNITHAMQVQAQNEINHATATVANSLNS